MRRIPLALAASAAVALAAAPLVSPRVPLAHADEIETSTVDYKDGDVALKGYRAAPPRSKALRPGVLVCHDWMGCGEFAKKRAEQLAAAGYVAFALDMYGDGKVASSQAEAKELVKPFYGDFDKMAARAKAGLDALLADPQVERSSVVAIGFCFGGSCALQLARSGAPLAGVVSFHGGLKTTKPAQEGTLKAKILVLHGGLDPNVPPADVAAFMDEMNKAKAKWRIEVYGGAVHAFTNPAAGNDVTKGAAYDADADRRSKQAQDQFLSELFNAK